MAHLRGHKRVLKPKILGTAPPEWETH